MVGLGLQAHSIVMSAALVLALSLAFTDMHRAAHNNDVTQIKALVAAGASVEAQDNMKRTPLHEAASEGHTDAIKALVAAGATRSSDRQQGDAAALGCV